MNITSIEEARKSRAPRIPRIEEFDRSAMMLGATLLALCMAGTLTIAIFVGRRIFGS